MQKNLIESFFVKIHLTELLPYFLVEMDKILVPHIVSYENALQAFYSCLEME